MSSTISPTCAEAVAHADTHERQGSFDKSSATAPPSPPMTESSAVTTHPVFRADARMVSLVEGLDGKCIDDPAETPFFRKRFGSLESLSISTPHATMVTSLPSRKTFARPTSNTEFSSYTQGTEARPIRM